MLGKSIAALTGILAVLLVVGCSNGTRGGGMPSVADINAQAALAQRNNEKAIDAAQNNPNLSDARKAALIDDLSGRHHGHGRPPRQPR